jgi:hypothetical protein
VAGGEGDSERAARLLGSAEMLREAMGNSRMQDPTLQRLHDRMVEIAQVALGDARFAAAWAEGAALPLEQAVCLAREEIHPR